VSRLPAINLANQVPDIRALPGLPFIGCISGDATTYVGTQMGGMPDLQALHIVRAAKKVIEEELKSRVVCKLPFATRPEALDVEIVRLTNEFAQIIETANEVIGRIQAEAEAAMQFINGKIDELNAAKAELLNIPEELRSKTERKMIERYEKYTGRLQSQITRMQANLDCIGSF
jgi:predicted nuclease with TOPRIM domain